MSPFSWSIRDWFWAFIVLGVSTLAGMGIWAMSPAFTGAKEPWYAEGRYYLVALFLTGAVSSVFLPRAFWVAPLGAYLGQLLYGVFLYEPDGVSFWPIGMVLALFYSVSTLAGGLAGALGMWALGICLGMLQFLFGRRKRKSAS